MVDISFDDVTLTYSGASQPAVEALDLRIDDGEFLVLVGPSGCGKSTTLRMLAGLELPDSGAIRFGDRDVTAVPARGRDIAMVFQSYALYPHMTVEGNMSFGLKNLRVPEAERAERVREAAELLDIDRYLDRKPRELSGGQRQRVAMGRAIVRQPEVFLMDEPLSNLDAKLRVQTRTQISALQRRLGVTTVYVTHDQTEAMTMGDRVVVMNAGRIEQIGTPRELYDAPATLFVAGFIGSPQMNLLPAVIADDGLHVGGLRFGLPADELPAIEGAAQPDEVVENDTRVIVGIRPEDLRPTAGDGLEIEVTAVEELGSDTFLHGTPIGIAGAPTVIARLGKSAQAEVGERRTFAVEPANARAFDSWSGLAIALAR